MSDEPEITTETTAELEAVTLDEGALVVDLAGLPPGSTVTLTVRVGPEPTAPPANEPPPQRRHMGVRPINGA